MSHQDSTRPAMTLSSLVATTCADTYDPYGVDTSDQVTYPMSNHGYTQFEPVANNAEGGGSGSRELQYFDVNHTVENVLPPGYECDETIADYGAGVSSYGNAVGARGGGGAGGGGGGGINYAEPIPMRVDGNGVSSTAYTSQYTVPGEYPTYAPTTHAPTTHAGYQYPAPEWRTQEAEQKRRSRKRDFTGVVPYSRQFGTLSEVECHVIEIVENKGYAASSATDFESMPSKNWPEPKPSKTKGTVYKVTNVRTPKPNYRARSQPVTIPEHIYDLYRPWVVGTNDYFSDGDTFQSESAAYRMSSGAGGECSRSSTTKVTSSADGYESDIDDSGRYGVQRSSVYRKHRKVISEQRGTELLDTLDEEEEDSDEYIEEDSYVEPTRLSQLYSDIESSDESEDDIESKSQSYVDEICQNDEDDLELLSSDIEFEIDVLSEVGSEYAHLVSSITDFISEDEQDSEAFNLISETDSDIERLEIELDNEIIAELERETESIEAAIRALINDNRKIHKIESEKEIKEGSSDALQPTSGDISVEGQATGEDVSDRSEEYELEKQMMNVYNTGYECNVSIVEDFEMSDSD